MKKKMVVRTFNLTDAVLKQKADEFIRLLDRDEAEFAERGYNAAAKLIFVSALETVNTMPSDESFEAEKMVLTEKKVAARSALEKAMRTIFSMAVSKYGEQSATYRTFGSANLTEQKDLELARTYKTTVKAANKNVLDMATEGLVPQRILDLSALGVTYDLSLDDVAEGISDRDMATEARVEALNNLYSIITKYAGIGQDIFYETNEAKYNDYVIYNTPSGLPEEPPI